LSRVYFHYFMKMFQGTKVDDHVAAAMVEQRKTWLLFFSKSLPSGSI